MVCDDFVEVHASEPKSVKPVVRAANERLALAVSHLPLVAAVIDDAAGFGRAHGVEHAITDGGDCDFYSVWRLVPVAIGAGHWFTSPAILRLRQRNGNTPGAIRVRSNRRAEDAFPCAPPRICSLRCLWLGSASARGGH